MPDSDNSVLVSSSNEPGLVIYDNGTPRAPKVNQGYLAGAFSLQIDPILHEIYTSGGPDYDVFTYGVDGLALKTKKP